nr:reverse transcriptase domain-containing protein [Tanacetum cinerariifolium]
MPLSVWEGLSLPELTPTCMTLELGDRSVSKPLGIAKDVSFKVGVFYFPADFVVVDFEPDPRVPLILRRCFLKTSRDLIDVHKGELTLRIGNEAITYNLDQTVRYSANYNQMTANKIDVVESACEEYSQEVELKNLPHHLEYAFLEGDDKLPIIIAKELRSEEKAALIKAPTEGYEDAIVVPAITADNFELKHGLLTLIQNKQFFGHDKEDPHAHVRYFNKITSTLKFPNVLNTSIKLTLFPFSLEDQDSLNFATGGNFLKKIPRECLAIIESKSKVRYSRNKPVVAKVSTNTSTFGISPDVAELKDMVKALLLDEESQSPAPVKAVEENYVTCGGAHSYRNCPATDGNVYRDNIQEIISQAFAVVENEPEATKDTMNPTNNGSTEDVQPQVVQSKFPILTSNPVTSLISEPVIAPVRTSKPNPKTSIPYPSRRNDERNHEKANNQIEKFYQIFKDMSFEISFADALILMPKFASTLKALIRNKEKLSEMDRTSLNEHCSAVLLNKLPKKLRDPGNFLIPCDFPGMAECLALADLGASINLMPLYFWKRLSLPDLTPTCMTLELTDRSISHPVGVAEDVYVKVGSFHFPADFVIVDFDADLRVPLILGRSFLKTERALIYIFEVDAFLAIEDDPNLPEFYQPYLDPEGDILFLEAFLNDDPSLPPPNQRNYLPEVRKELKIYETKSNKSLVDEPPAVKLKYLPTHLEYAFLEGDDKLPIIIAKDSSVKEKAALITVLKSHKRAIAWKLSDIKGIDPEFCTHKILMEENFEPAVQPSKSQNPRCYQTRGCKFRFSLAAKITEILVVTVSLCRVLRLGFSLVGRSLLSEIPRVESTNFKFDRDEPVDKGDILIKEHVLDFLLTMNHSKEADNLVPRSLSYLVVHIIDTHVHHLEVVVTKLDISTCKRRCKSRCIIGLLNMIQRQQEIKNMFIVHNATLSTVSSLPDLDLGLATLGISLRRDGPTGEKANLGTQPNETVITGF